MEWQSFSVTTTHEASELLCELFAQMGAVGIAVKDAQDIVDIISVPDSAVYTEDDYKALLEPDVYVHAYFSRTDEGVRVCGLPRELDISLDHSLYSQNPQITSKEDEVVSCIRYWGDKMSAFMDVGVFDVTHQTVLMEDWENNWKKDYEQFDLTERIVVCPSWERCHVDDDKKIIYLDPGSAFGTGTHETTSMCARLLDECIDKDDFVLDLGTGSGILSIVAAKLGASYVEAIDIDPLATKVAQDNIVANDCDLSVHSGELKDALRKDYSIIVANIIADVLVDLAPDFSDYLVSEGKVLASGIIASKKDRVIEAFTQNGYIVSKEKTQNDWYAIEFTHSL